MQGCHKPSFKKKKTKKPDLKWPRELGRRRLPGELPWPPNQTHVPLIPSQLAHLLPDSGAGHKSDDFRLEAQERNCILKSTTCDNQIHLCAYEIQRDRMHGM